MKLKEITIIFLVILHGSFAPPVTQDKSKEQDSDIKDDLEEYMEYHRYLKEVVQALESDPDFRERLEKADEEDVRSGKIAEQLDFVNHNVRTKLDEIKRRELDRLRQLAEKQIELTNDVEVDKGKVPSNEHLDHANPHTFEIEDLKKLIMKTTADLETADKQRKEQFKEYEMQKEFEKHQKMEKMDEVQKKEYMEKMKREEFSKKQHQPIHHPGSKQQLEEVWEKQDQMDQQFDPKAFFMLHDVDGNGMWDADEVKALFIKELDKVYGPGGPNKDLHERAEEMERMREHVFKENDKNHDGLIDFYEFMVETQRADFNKDEGWKPIDENQIYTQAEYEEFEKRRLEEMRYLQQRGLLDANGRPVPGAQQQIHQYQQAQLALQQGYQHFLEQQQGQVPPQHMARHVSAEAFREYRQSDQPQAQSQYQQPQFQGQQQPPQGQYQAQQHPQGQYQAQQVSPQGQYQAKQQPPQGQYQGQQMPLQGQYQGQQMPSQGQYHGQQMPSQGQYQGQQQPPQGQYQGQQQLPQGQYQGQQVPPQGQYQGQQQPPQGVYQGQQQPPQGQYQSQQQPPQGQQQAPQVQNQQNPNKQPPMNTVDQPPQVQGQVQPGLGQGPPAQAQGQGLLQPTQGQGQPKQGQAQG